MQSVHSFRGSLRPGEGGEIGPGPSTTTVHKWRSHLQDQMKMANTMYARAVKEIHEEEKTSETLTCMRCKQPKYRLDFTTLECCPEKQLKERYKGRPPPHRFCIECVTDLIAEHKVFDASSQDVVLQGLSSEAMNIVVCPLCRTPNVLMAETRFHEGFARRNITRNGVMKIVVVHLGATKLLSDNFAIDECYENQRRPLFGSFSGDNLLTTDWRGNFSTPGASEIENREEYYRKPNSSWVWLEDWRPDETLGGCNGWMYAGRWPDNSITEPMAGWDRYISLFYFVRRRRLLRTRIRLNEEVYQELLQIQKELEEKRL